MVNSTPSTPSATITKLSFREKFAYGLGDTASNFYFQAFNLFLFYYYTDIFGLSVAHVGIMMLVARVLDAVLDPLMGIWADRTSTRWGKFRPFILWAAIPYGILGYVMFLNPSYSYAGKLIFAYVTYISMWLVFTVINIPYSALMAVMTPSSKDRTSLSAFRFTCAFGGQLLIGALVLPLKDVLGGDDPAAGFRNTMGIFAIASVAMFLYTFSQTRERVHPPREQDSSIGKDVRALVANVPWRVMVGVALFSMIALASRNASIVYYCKYNIGDESVATVFMVTGSVIFVFGSIFTKQILCWFTRKQVMVFGPLLSGAACLGFAFVDPQWRAGVHVLNALVALGMSPTPTIVWSFYSDIADYGEWQFGRRATGLVVSGALFALKVGLALGSGLLGLILGQSGFVANAVQTDSALAGIVLAFAVVPGVLTIISGFAILLYPLSDGQLTEIEAGLIKRRATVPET